MRTNIQTKAFENLIEWAKRPTSRRDAEPSLQEAMQATVLRSVQRHATATGPVHDARVSA